MPVHSSHNSKTNSDSAEDWDLVETPEDCPRNEEEAKEEEEVDGFVVLNPVDVLISCWFWIMYCLRKLPVKTIAMTSAVFAASAVIAHDFYQKKFLASRDSNNRLTQNKDETEESRMQYLNLLKMLEEQDRLEEEENEQAHRSAILKHQKELGEVFHGLASQEKQYQIENLRQRQESEKQLENMKLDFQIKNLLRDQNIRMNDRVQDKKFEIEMAEKERVLAASRRRFDDELSNSHTNFQKKTESFQDKETARKRQDHRDEQEFQQRIFEIRHQLERDMEQVRYRHEARRREMDHLLDEARRALQMKIWNEVIENNWTRRLNTLRSANDDVKKAWRDLEVCKDPEIHEIHLDHVKKAVEIQKSLMTNEAVELDKMHRETGREFLLTIKEAVNDVKRECERLEYAIENDNSLLKSSVSSLSRASMDIPTLAELKSQFFFSN